jgi:hypothetical protein
MDLPRPFFKFHDRVINVQAISDIHIEAPDKVTVRMLAPDAIFSIEGQEAKVLLAMLHELWVDARV